MEKMVKSCGIPTGMPVDPCPWGIGLKITSGFIFTLIISGCATVLVPMNTVKKNDVVTVKKEIDKGADVNAKDEFGGTALMWAQIPDHLQMIYLLKQHGAK